MTKIGYYFHHIHENLSSFTQKGDIPEAANVSQRHFLLHFSYISKQKKKSSLLTILLTNRLILLYVKTMLHF